MAPSTTLRTSRTGTRAAGVVATATLASLLTITPAFARPDPGDPAAKDTSGSSRVDGSQVQNGPSEPTSDTRIYQSTIERQNLEEMRRRAATTTQPGPATVTLDDNAVEYLQIGLGALAGLAAAGATAAAFSARRHHAHTPA